MLQTNLGGVVNGVRAFLPILMRQNSGVIVNTSSVFGLARLMPSRYFDVFARLEPLAARLSR